jgi:nucleotide-binding universal stress UspA family protein
MIAIDDILVATDFGEAADSALQYGRELAGKFGATLHVLNVVEDLASTGFALEAYSAIVPELQREAEATARHRLHALVLDSDVSGPQTKTSVKNGPAAYAIVDYAREHDIDLIVMGTHGRGALAHVVIGSVAERVVRLAPCPVLTVRCPEREFVRPDALTVAARV